MTWHKYMDLNFLKDRQAFIKYVDEHNCIIKNQDDEYIEYSKIVTHEEEAFDFSYKINKEGFRSQNFLNLPDEFILTAGCSVTFGQGLPDAYRWGSLVSQKTNLPVYDISTMGIDATGIIKNINTFINKYKKPSTILILLPMVNRFKGILYDKEDNKSYVVFSQPLGGQTKEQIVKWMNQRENLLGFFDFVTEIRMLETYCKEAGIKLKWSTWDQASSEFLKDFDFQNFIGLISSDNIFDIKKSDDQLAKKYWDFALDGSHPGVLFQMHVATMFYNSM